MLAAGLSSVVTLPALILFSSVGAMTAQLVRWTHHPRMVAALGLAIMSLPYSVWLGRFTFSGPTVIDLPYQPLLVAILGFVVALGFGLTFLIYSYATTRSLRRLFLSATCLAASATTLLLNQHVLPGLYEPLHTLLSIYTALGLLLSLYQLVALVWPGPVRRAWLSLPLLTLLALGFIWADWRLPSAPRVGALITQAAITPRYLVLARASSRDAPVPLSPVLLTQLKPKFSAPGALEARLARRRNPPNLVLFFVDNMSPSRVGFAGYRKRPTTPNMDRLATHGAIFSQAYSVIPHTRSFASSLLLGRYSHLSAPERIDPQWVEDSVTHVLHRHGYSIMALNWFELSRSTHFDPKRWGIDTYVRPPTPDEEAATDRWPVHPVPQLLDQVRQHLDEARSRQAPVMLWLHMVHPHGLPRGREGMYHHDPQFAFGPSLDDRYDGAIASADQWFAPLKEILDAGLTNPGNTYFLFGSDHGAGMTRFRKKVSKTTWQDHVHVPLALVGPGIARGTYDYTVDSALDVAATLLDLAGLEPPEDYDGISLLPLVTGARKPTAPRPVIVAVPPQWEGVIWGYKKLVKNRGTLSLFDLSVDPDEQQDIAEREPELVRELGQLASDVLQRRTRARASVAAKLKADDEE